MDDRRFDTLARALGAATSRRGAIAALAAIGLAGAAAPAADAAKGQRRKCRKDSPAGQCCRKDGTCTCKNGGTVCGANCCLVGQVCDAGTCVQEPEPDTCIAFGEPCKGVGKECCDNLACASGQGGSTPACHVPAGGSCLVTADCAYGSTCQNDVCVADPPPPTCIPTFEPTGDPVADGETLQALVAAANGTSGRVISLGSGTYTLSPVYDLTESFRENVSLVWSSGSIVVQGCPGSTAKLALPTNGGFFLVDVKGGSMTLRSLLLDAPGAPVSPGSTALLARSGGSMTLEAITLTGFTVGVTNGVGSAGSTDVGTVTVVGGSYSVAGPAGTSGATGFNGPGTAWFCSGNPQISATGANGVKCRNPKGVEGSVGPGCGC